MCCLSREIALESVAEWEGSAQGSTEPVLKGMALAPSTSGIGIERTSTMYRLMLTDRRENRLLSASLTMPLAASRR
jgi:hypothetical protein